MKTLTNGKANSQAGVHPSSGFGNVYLFTGRRLDDNTGVHYYRNRYYEASIGRFLGRDPLEYIDGLNTYIYATNNSIKYTDPYGLQGDTCPGKITEKGTGNGTNWEEACEKAYDQAWDQANARCKTAGKKKDKQCLLRPGVLADTVIRDRNPAVTADNQIVSGYRCRVKATYFCDDIGYRMKCVKEKRIVIDGKLQVIVTGETIIKVLEVSGEVAEWGILILSGGAIIYGGVKFIGKIGAKRIIKEGMKQGGKKLVKPRARQLVGAS